MANFHGLLLDPKDRLMPQNPDHPNIFQMAVAHGGPGFWVRRTTWESTCARVVGVGDFSGPAPYYGSPPVIADVYGLDGKLKEELAALSVPGTFKTWRRIDQPVWGTQRTLRPLEDPAVAKALEARDRRKRSTSQQPRERIVLDVPYSRKDEAKAIGARWDPAERVWWIPIDQAKKEKAAKLGFLAGSAS